MSSNKSAKSAKKNQPSFVQSLISVAKPVEKKLNEYLSNNETPEDAVARILLTGILKNQYHRSVDNLAKESIQLLTHQAIHNPSFLLKAAGFARQSHMKGMVKVAIASILGQSKEDFVSNNQDEIISILKTFHPGQLLQFVELCKSKALGRGFGSRAQKIVSKAMNSWNYTQTETYTLKYPKALNNLLRLVHPKISADKSSLYSYVLTDLPNQKREITGTSQKIVEMLKKLDNNALVASQMLEYNVPWDVIKGFAGMGPEIARSCLRQMGLTALLLNMRSLDEKGVFDKEGIEVLKSKMKQVQNGRSLPIDFAKPYIHSTNPAVKDILLNAMVETLDIPMPYLENKRVGVTVDISGSMNGEPLTTAGLLSIPFLKANNLWFTTFDDCLHEEGSHSRYRGDYEVCPKISGLPRKEQVRNLLNMKTAGSTDVTCAIRKATETKRVLDLIILITDEQQNTGHSNLKKTWNEYKKKVNPEACLWVINAQNTEWHSADFEDPSITVYQTMTPAIFKNLQYLGVNLVEAISNFDFKAILKEPQQQKEQQKEEDDSVD